MGLPIVIGKERGEEEGVTYCYRGRKGREGREGREGRREGGGGGRPIVNQDNGRPQICLHSLILFMILFGTSEWIQLQFVNLLIRFVPNLYFNKYNIII